MFHTAIIKLTARCNLDCTYCYVFNQADKTYTRVPKAMPIATALECLDRIHRHAAGELHSGRFSIVLHGGEPTLWPLASLRTFLDRVEQIRNEGIDLAVGMQSNGVRLRAPLLELLDEHGVRIGISLDGPKANNDHFRVDHAGRGSYDQIMRSVSTAIESGYGHLLAGFLAVAQPTISPTTFLDWADSLPIRRLDVLWPIEFNYDHPPWTGTDLASYARRPTYGAWFADLFAEWWRRNDPTLEIRHFYQVIQVLLGGTEHTDTIVNDVLDMFVINTDGQVEYPDYFRSFADGACRTPFNVATDDLDTVAADPVFDFCLHLGDHRPSECDGCPCVRECGGGFLPGRMREGETLPRERSVLCLDHLYFFSTVREILAQHRDELPEPSMGLARV